MTTPPDEVRAALQSQFVDVRVHTLDVDTLRIYPTPRQCELRFQGRLITKLDYQTDAIVRAAYASGSAARRERDVGIVRGIDVSIYGHMDARAAIEEAIERINKE